jgi:hypothetical protein
VVSQQVTPHAFYSEFGDQARDRALRDAEVIGSYQYNQLSVIRKLRKVIDFNISNGNILTIDMENITGHVDGVGDGNQPP